MCVCVCGGGGGGVTRLKAKLHSNAVLRKENIQTDFKGFFFKNNSDNYCLFRPLRP